MMKKLILIFIGFTTVFLMSLEADEYILKAKGEQCSVVENVNRGTVETDCIEMVNSNKIHIYCTKTKKVCKTKDEIWEVFDDLTSDFSTKEKELLSGMSEIKRRMSYPVARKIIIQNGWIPNDIQEEAIGNQLKELRERWKEVEDCSGLGVGYCRFNFHDTLGNQLHVTTAGEWNMGSKQYGGVAGFSLVVNSLPLSTETRESIVSTSKFKNAKKDCEKGYAEQCSEVGSYYEKGQGVEQDYIKAEEFYRKSCNGGNPWGCIGLGDVYKKEKKFLQAKEIWSKTCDEGHPEGCTNLGTLYYSGQGMTQDYAKAKELFTKGCNGADGGDTYGCLYLGLLYAYGKGVNQDYAKAKELLDKTGCDGSQIEMCKELKLLCDSNQGVKKDQHSSNNVVKNLNAFAKGMKAYENNDFRKAKKFWSKACDTKNASGCYNLGLLYEKGQGVRQNYSKAKDFYGQSCDNGLEKGCSLYSKLNTSSNGYAIDKHKNCKHHIMISGLAEQSYTNPNGYLAIRSGPGGKYKLLEKVVNGSNVKGCAVKGNWIKIIYGCAESGSDTDDTSIKCKWGWAYKKYLLPMDNWNMKY